MSLASLATSQPDPIERPMSADLSAMASAALSPVTDIECPSCLRPITRRFLSYGVDLARILSLGPISLNFSKPSSC